jgi:hypothetical protein
VKYLRWIIVVFGIFPISVLSIAVRVDDPETAYEETESPVNLTIPVSITRIARTILITVEHPVAISRGQRVCRDARTTVYAITAKRALPVSHSRLNLLCTLLC